VLPSRNPAIHDKQSESPIVTLGIPVKVNADSGGKPNGIPERR
jgi:hypothetical protein